MIRTRWFSVFITLRCWYYARALGRSSLNCKYAMGSTMFGMLVRHRKCHCRKERRSFGIVLNLQLSAVRFYDSADAGQTKPIMSLSDVTEWFPPPILRIRRENRFWFMERE